MNASKFLVLAFLLALPLATNSTAPPRMHASKEADKVTQLDGASETQTIRLFMVRHGETLANIQKIVVGQSDSPLTKLGQRQAIALGNNDIIKDVEFWRRYASDLQRTQHTALLIDSDHSFILDERLREIAKGAREGFPKSYTMDQCMECFKSRPEEVPKLESSEDAWRRLSKFLHHLLHEAELEDERFQYGKVGKKARNVLVVSHSGTIRLLLHKLLPDAHPLLQVSADTAGALDDSKRFQIPNTSLTILDISMHPIDTESENSEGRIKADLVTLNSIDHLADF